LETETCDIAIVGAGAAGLATAIFAAEHADRAGRDRHILCVDGAKRIGAKILVSGGGRCNVTHEAVRHDDYNGPKNIVRNILREFTETRTVEWMAEMGVELKREPTGKLFPVTDKADTVLGALLERCVDLGVELRRAWRVDDLRKIDDGFALVSDDGRELHARRVVMATGGRSLPKTGSDGHGWAIVRRLGHTVMPTYPALVPLVLNDAFFHAELSGVSHNVELETYVDGKRVDQRCGSMLWTHFGISGPVVMDASRHWVIAHTDGRRAELRCCFVPGSTGAFDVIDRRLVDAGQANPQVSTVRVAGTIASDAPGRVIESLCRHVGVDPSVRVAQLPREARRDLAHALIGLPLPVVSDRGWNYAEVTAGGVPLAEVDRRTMASRVVDGLYLVGEMLDCEGRIGGFNFQWAWASGHIAGAALATALVDA